MRAIELDEAMEDKSAVVNSTVASTAQLLEALAAQGIDLSALTGDIQQGNSSDVIVVAPIA